MQADEAYLSAASYVELCAVLRRRYGGEAINTADKIIALSKIKIMPVTTSQARVAVHAGQLFPVLNYGGTFSYALTQEMNLPLLFKGDDFSKTDLHLVEY